MQLNNTLNKAKPVSVTRKPSFSTVSSMPYSGTNMPSAASDASGIVSLKIRYMNTKQGAKHIFTALGRQKPIDFNPFSLSTLSLDPSEALGSVAPSRKSFCPGIHLDSEMIKQGKIYLRGRYLCGSCYVMFAGDMNIL